MNPLIASCIDSVFEIEGHSVVFEHLQDRIKVIPGFEIFTLSDEDAGLNSSQVNHTFFFKETDFKTYGLQDDLIFYYDSIGESKKFNFKIGQHIYDGQGVVIVDVKFLGLLDV